MNNYTDVLDNQQAIEDYELSRAQDTLLATNMGQGTNLEVMINRISDYGVPMPTRFSEIDKPLGGGIRVGITILAAPPTAGKTTLALQLAEQFSQSNIQTLYLSNDMAEEELVSKALSRHSFSFLREKGYSTAEILNQIKELKSQPAFQFACNSFKNSAQMLRIDSSELARNLDGIKWLLNTYAVYGRTKQKVVIIDYLQNIDVEYVRTDKERVDILIRELKTLAVNLKLAIIVISSVSRGNYNLSLTMSSLKESGGLEYGADVIIGIQYQGVGLDGFNLDKSSSTAIRKMELVVLKNRFGNSNFTIPMDFYSKFNLFPYYDTSKKMRISRFF